MNIKVRGRVGKVSRMEPLPMSPADMTDTELDAAVAVEVMVWEWRQIVGGDSQPQFAWFNPATTSHTHRNWSPTTDIAAAFEAVERMRELGHMFIGRHHDTKTQEWRCIFWQEGYGQGTKKVCDSLPRAICEAALAAVRSSI